MSISGEEGYFQCEVCGDRTYEPVFEATDYKLKTTDRFFSLIACSRCGHVVLHPMPEEKDLNRYYPSSFYRTGPATLSLIDRLNYHLIFRKIQKIVPSGKLLDVGCGNGDFLVTAAKHGYDVYGQEVSDEGARLGRKKLGDRIYGKNLFECNFPSEYFDVITLWHVAEHVLNIKPYLSEIRRILKPGGAIFLEVPNFHCFERKLFGKYWLHLEVPRHVRFFNEFTLKKLLENTGFTCETNKGWGAIIFPFSLWNNFTFYLQIRVKKNCALLRNLLRVPGMLINTLTYLSSYVFGSSLVIGVTCRKSHGR